MGLREILTPIGIGPTVILISKTHLINPMLGLGAAHGAPQQWAERLG